MTSTLTRYRDDPDHPLHDIPADVLDAARTAVGLSVTAGHVDGELADPIADAIVAAVAEWLTVSAAHTCVPATSVPAEIRLAAYRAMTGPVDWHDVTADAAGPLANTVVAALSGWLD